MFWWLACLDLCRLCRGGVPFVPGVCRGLCRLGVLVCVLLLLLTVIVCYIYRGVARVARVCGVSYVRALAGACARDARVRRCGFSGGVLCRLSGYAGGLGGLCWLGFGGVGGCWFWPAQGVAQGGHWRPGGVCRADISLVWC